MKGIDLDGTYDTELTCDYEGWEEFEVDIGHELVRMNEQGMWLVMLIFIL